jgi:nucleoside triphosphate pyrophosphatase
MKEIILASQSPRRKQLLEWAEIPFRVVVKETDERFPVDSNPTEATIHIARNKALAIADGVDNGVIILAADTIVVINEEILGKPTDRDHAIQTLQRLAGKTHDVITGVAIMQGKKEYTFAESTSVTFHELTEEQIIFYIDNYKPYDKAGAYAIQEWIGVVGIKSISGDFYNVMGLPVSRVYQALQNPALYLK